VKLNEIEKTSGLWKKIDDELNSRLASLREQNDGERTQDETAKIRGRIAEIKTILSWAKADPQLIE
jgi:ribosomal protein L29